MSCHGLIYLTIRILFWRRFGCSAWAFLLLPTNFFFRLSSSSFTASSGYTQR